MSSDTQDTWWRGAVIYQIYPRSFADSNGDGIGDLPGITARLPHIASLGVDAIWLSPFFRSPMKDFGYDVSDYRAVDPLFGTLEDFDALLDRAHMLGLKVIIDQVMNHSSDQHEWFRTSRSSRDNPMHDWYVWADPKPDGTPPNNWLSIFGGPAWQWESRRKQYYLHSFLAEQPDFNLHNPAVQEAVLADTAFWMDRGVDGVRLDAIVHAFHDELLRDNPPSEAGLEEGGGVSAANPYTMQLHVHDNDHPDLIGFLRRIRGLLNRYPGRMAVAEVGGKGDLDRASRYTASDDLLHTAYTFQLMQGGAGPRALKAALEGYGRGWPSWAMSNHDAVRSVTRWGDGTAASARVVLACLLSLRGTAFVYQGEELGLTEARLSHDQLRDPYGITFWPDFPGRDGARTPIPWTATATHAGFSDAEPWLPIPPEHRHLAVDVQEADAGSMLGFTRAFLGWRKAQPCLRAGDMDHIDATDQIFSQWRGGNGQRLWMVFNLSPDPAHVSVPDGLSDARAPFAMPLDRLGGAMPGWSYCVGYL